MMGPPAVGVDDDLAPGQPGITFGAADLEPAGGVEKHRYVVVPPLAHRRPDHMLHDEITKVALAVVPHRMVLRRQKHRLDLLRPTVTPGDRDLRLRIGSKTLNDARLAHCSLSSDKAMGQDDRQRHELIGLVRRIPEHEALVAGAEHLTAVDATGNVARLLLHDHPNIGAIGIEPRTGTRIPDAADGVTGALLDLVIEISGEFAGPDLATNDEESTGDEGLARHPGVGVETEGVVEHGVADAVGDLVRVSH